MFRSIWPVLVPVVGFTLVLPSSNIVLPTGQQAPQSTGASKLMTTRGSDGDLEIGGDLSGLTPGSVRYVRYEDLLALPQETFKVTDDTNFHGATEISGIALTTLAKLFGQGAHSDLSVAICYDKYRANYPSDYLAAHHPVLVLKINGQLRDKWPKSEDDGPLGPYLITHPVFKPSFAVLSHKDEAQIPFGVTRLEFRSESQVYGAIKPEGAWNKDSPVWQGYRIAREDCFRCHSMHGEGGTKAARSWLVLGAWAESDPERFEQYIHNPQDVQAGAKMPAHSDYDAATLHALTAYFKTFVPARKTP